MRYHVALPGLPGWIVARHPAAAFITVPVIRPIRHGVLFVDVTDNGSTVREYADAQAYVDMHSAFSARTPRGRLEALTSYLGLSWSSVTRRCAQLAEYGLAAIVEPRSRLLGLRGADRACAFLGNMASDSR